MILIVVKMVLKLVTICSVIFGCYASGKLYVDRPRGVPLSRKPLYDPHKDFTCLDGSATVPFAWVNDDYCDCKDGTDEPGTSACSNGRFHCVNLGHVPMNIPSSRVNDQICDCCDGSDEHAGYVQCGDVCEEIGKQARIDAEERAELLKAGYQKRQELAKEGQKMKAEKQKQLADLKKEKDDLDPKRDELDMTKQDAEKKENEAKDKFKQAWEAVQKEKRKQEALAAFAVLDENKDNKITVDELVTKKEFDTDADGTVTPEEAKAHLAEKEESDTEHFLSEVWDDMRKIWRPPGATPSTQGDESPPNIATTTTAPPSMDDITVPPPKIEGEEEDEEEIQGDEVEDFDSEKYMKDGEKSEPEEEPMPDYDEDTKKLIEAADEARRLYDEVDRKFSSLLDDIKHIEEFLGRDYGPDMAFAPLEGQCFDFKDSQYLYKLCMFHRSSQAPKSGGGETSLGNWDAWAGPDDNKYSRQSYKNGQSCWNGPERSTLVKLDCGSETKLVGASEPGRCEYEFLAHTPAVCEEPLPYGHHPEHEL